MPESIIPPTFEDYSDDCKYALASLSEDVLAPIAMIAKSSVFCNTDEWKELIKQINGVKSFIIKMKDRIDKEITDDQEWSLRQNHELRTIDKRSQCRM